MAANALLAWYDRNARKLPWRVGPRDRALGVRPDPYAVWLSEIMLQQTTVTAVKPYFETFTKRWPDVGALAAAPREDVLKAWAGLGYYARARNLKACAEQVVTAHDGRFPETEAELRTLPGIGVYTAAAIAAIAFDEPAPVVDGNIERVIARTHTIDTPLPAAKAVIRDIQADLTPPKRAGDYAQALMDLGATICTPKRPACSLCPWSDICAARAAGNQEDYPVKVPKSERPTRYGAAFVAIRKDGAILLRRRAERGLLGGMTEVPGVPWEKNSSNKATDNEWLVDAPFRAKWTCIPGPVIHVFTHFRLEILVFRADVSANCPAPADAWWAEATDVPGEALPSVMKKVIEKAVPHATKRTGQPPA